MRLTMGVVLHQLQNDILVAEMVQKKQFGEFNWMPAH